MKKHLGLVSAYTESYETRRFLEEAENLGISMFFIYAPSLLIYINRYGKISLKISKIVVDEIKSKFPKINFLYDFEQVKFSGIFIRSTFSSDKDRLYWPLMTKYFLSLNIPVLNSKLNLRHLSFNKISQFHIFSKNQIPIVPTVLVGSQKALNDISDKEIDYPFFIKPHNASHGNGAKVVNNFFELSNAYNSMEDSSYTLIQKRIALNWDIRVLVLGKKVLGAMKRTAQKGADISNFSAGGSVEKYNLSGEEELLALKVAKVFDADYGGVDIMYDSKDRPYVLEFNRNAQFKGFEMATGQNVARQLIEYILSV